MATFRQSFIVNAPLEAVWKFHEDPVALEILNPPPLTAEILSIDRPLKQGSILKFALKAGPVTAATWTAHYDEFRPYQMGDWECGFVDSSIKSPFKYWVHQHTFQKIDATTTRCNDFVTFKLTGDPVTSWILGWPALLVLFTWRRMATIRALKTGWVGTSVG